MKEKNYLKEIKESIEIIYECTPLYTVLKITSKVILAVFTPLQLAVIQQVINAVAGVLAGREKTTARSDNGSIYVNQCKLSELDEDTMRRLFSVIFQDYTKYSFSLRENVAFGNMSACGKRCF